MALEFTMVNEKKSLVQAQSEHSIYIMLRKINNATNLSLYDLLDHAWIRKTDVIFNDKEKILTIKLKRHLEGSKAKKKSWLGVLWNNSIAPTQESILQIKNIKQLKIHDKDLPENKEVILGGLVNRDNKIYLTAFCAHENDYRIVIDVTKLDIYLNDT